MSASAPVQRVKQLSGSVKDSFAYYTIKDRLPVTVEKALEDVRTTCATSDESSPGQLPGGLEAGEAVASGIERLLQELRADAPLAPLPRWMADAALWGGGTLDGLTWMKAPWLTCECYLYRRLQQVFATAGAWDVQQQPTPALGREDAFKYWAAYDVFQRRKQEAFWASAGGMAETAEEVTPMLERPPVAEQLQQECRELLQYALWGNRADLSLHASFSISSKADAGQSGEASSSSSNGGSAAVSDLLVDDTDDVWALVSGLRNARVDIVLDNSGFELFMDLLLADWLVSRGFAAEVVLHTKAFPWFVSDTTVPDFHWTLGATSEAADKLPPGSPAAAAAMRTLAKRWMGHCESGAWRLASHPFWTGPSPLWDMPKQAGDLFGELADESSLVVFKGDLNYRKIVGDGMWEATTPLGEAAGELFSARSAAAGRRFPPTLLLRTCKSDTIVGLPKGLQQKVEEWEAQAGKSKYGYEWLTEGRYGMVQFWHDLTA